MTEPRPHTLEFHNDDLALTLTATVDDRTWERLSRALMATLIQASAPLRALPPNTVITPLSQREADEIRKRWTEPIAR